jgi:hypothetical protein
MMKKLPVMNVAAFFYTLYLDVLYCFYTKYMLILYQFYIIFTQKRHLY